MAAKPTYEELEPRIIELETAVKALEEQLWQSQKMETMGTLVGGVAHDFNNLLTAIIGNAHLALMETDNDAPLRGELEDIKTAGERAAALTRQLLAFSQKQLIQAEILDLNEILRNTEKMLVRLIEEHIELQTIYEPELRSVEMDPGHIEQVIINLALNARDAMPQGGTLTIETSNVDLEAEYFIDRDLDKQPGPYVMLSVGNTGIGKEIYKSTGLSMSTVYGIVKQNGGFIQIHSEPGKGSTFKIYLPVVTDESESIEKKLAFEDVIKGSENVLIVEDDHPLRKLACKVLQQHGYRILEAQNGEEALQVCEEHDDVIHLLVTDVVMPAISGRELAHRMQTLQPEIKVIYMSGYPDKTISHYGVLEPGMNFIEKPFSPERLVHKVREVLDEK
jgi:CheY-like chemotaxis protein